MYKILDECGVDWLYPSMLNRPVSKLDNGADLIVAWDNTRWIVLSSIIFAIPAYWNVVYYTFNPMVDEWNDHRVIYNKRFVIVNASTIFASVVSVNYWRKPMKGWRRNLDLIVAKVAFITCVYNGVTLVQYKPYVYMSFLIYYGCYYFYNQSSIKTNQYDMNWFKYHFMFHICVGIGFFFVSDGIRMRIQNNI